MRIVRMPAGAPVVYIVHSKPHYIRVIALAFTAEVFDRCRHRPFSHNLVQTEELCTPSPRKHVMLGNNGQSLPDIVLFHTHNLVLVPRSELFAHVSEVNWEWRPFHPYTAKGGLLQPLVVFPL